MAAVLVHAYPWDFDGDDSAAERAAGLGVDGVAVAASYHATRAASPLHPSRALLEAEHAACYVPVRPAAWAGRRLVPRTPAWVSSTDSFGSARRRLEEVGLATHAWLVLTHNSALGRAHPDLVVHNAFGDRYPYALCPSAPDVVEYCLTLVDEVLLAGPLAGIVLEACGPMGVEHNGRHEKTSLAGWDSTQRQLLSICFCTACTARYGAAGLDTARVAERVRAASRGRPGTVEQALGRDVAAAVSAVRTGIAAELRQAVVRHVAATSADTRVTLHAAAGPWATGSFPTVAPSVAAPVDALVAPCTVAQDGIAELTALRSLAGTGPRLGGFVRPEQDWRDEPLLEETVRRCRQAGMDELHLYHLGLVGQRGLSLLRHAATSFRAAG